MAKPKFVFPKKGSKAKGGMATMLASYKLKGKKKR